MLETAKPLSLAVSTPRKGIARNDRHDIDRRELKLIRVGHALWAIYKKERRKSGNVSEERALEAALHQVWDLKKEVRRDIAAERRAKFALVRDRFRKAVQKMDRKLENFYAQPRLSA